MNIRNRGVGASPPRRCRSCRSEQLEVIVDLGEQPASDFFPAAAAAADADPRASLRAVMCVQCSLVQLAGSSPMPEQQPVAAESASSRRHARLSAAAVVAEDGFSPGTSVLELTSHHGGSWLQDLRQHGFRPIADPHDGVRASAELVIDVHALAHEDDLDAALASRTLTMAPGGSLILEFHHLLPLIQQGQFDTVRHGHPVYLSLLALQPALHRHGLVMVSATETEVFGGSMRLVATRNSTPAKAPSVARVLAAERAAGLDSVFALRSLQARADSTSAALREYLLRARSSGRTVIGYGAPSKASVLLTYSGVGPELLPFTADLSPDKQGRRLPGCAVPIRSPEDLLAEKPDEVLVLTWDIAHEVAEQLKQVRTWGGKFILPVPHPHEYQHV